MTEPLNTVNNSSKESIAKLDKKGLMRVRKQRVSRPQKESKNRSKAQLKVTALHNKTQ